MERGINLERLGELGESIKNFNYNTFREENREFLNEIYDLYYNAIKDNIFDKDSDKENLKTCLIVMSKVKEILNDEEYFEVLVSKRLDSLVDRIFRDIYDVKDTYYLDYNCSGVKQKLSDENYIIPILSGKNIRIKSEPFAEELSKIKPDDFRKLLFDTVGFEFTSMRELYNKRNENITADKTEIKALWAKNGFDSYIIRAWKLETTEDPFMDESFYRDDKRLLVNTYKGNISRFRDSSKKYVL